MNLSEIVTALQAAGIRSHIENMGGGIRAILAGPQIAIDDAGQPIYCAWLGEADETGALVFESISVSRHMSFYFSEGEAPYDETWEETTDMPSDSRMTEVVAAVSDYVTRGVTCATTCESQ